MLALRLLGGVELLAGTGRGARPPLSSKKAQGLLAYLAASPGRAHRREALIALLWPETAPRQGRDSLRQALAVLRKAIGASAVLTEGDTVALRRGALSVDVVDLADMVKGDVTALAQVRELYRGDFLAGVSPDAAPFEEWVTGQRGRYRDLAINALERLAEMQAGEPHAAIDTLRHVLSIDATRQSAHRTLMRRYVAIGQPEAALKQYEQCVTILRRELGVTADAETRNVYQEILRSRPVGSARRAPRAGGRPAVEAAADERLFVARDGELATLATWFAAARSGRGNVGIVLGEVGIGKTRLVERFAERARGEGGLVLTGRCFDTERILPLQPWIEALRDGLVTAGEPAALSPMARTELSRFLGDLGGPPATRETSRTLLFDAVLELLRHFGSASPVVVVLEDLHWADEMTVSLLSYAARRIAALPVLVVASVRGSALPDAPGLGQAIASLERSGHALRIVLTSLSHAETLALVRASIATDRPDAASLAEQIWELSRGNPFMAVEAVHTAEHGASVAGGDGLATPARVREMVAARLARCTERARQVAALAAVVGRAFDFPLLAAASGIGEIDAAAAVEELTGRQVLGVAGRQLDFTHDRIREVAYGQILPPVRVALHLAVARAIETTYGADRAAHAGALAVHYRESETWDRAVDAFRQAGMAALGRSGHREAARCFEQALEILPRLPSTREHATTGIDLRFDLRHSLLPLGETRRVGRVIDEAVELATGLRDEDRLGRALAVRGHYRCIAGALDDAVVDCQRAGVIAEKLGDAALATSAVFYEGVVQHALGEFPRSIELMERARASASGGLTSERYGTTSFTAAYAATGLAWSLAELGDLAAAETAAEEALAIADRSAQPFVQYQAYTGAARVSLYLGDWDGYLAIGERYQNVVRSAYLGLAAPLDEWTVAHGAALAGRPNAAALVDAAAERIPREPRQTYFYSLRLGWLGEAALRVGRLAVAAQLVDQALALARARSERPFEGWNLLFRGEIRLQQTPEDEVPIATDFNAAMAIGDALAMRPLVARCRLGLGRLAARRSAAEDARREIGAAADIFRTMGATSLLAMAQAELTKLTPAPPTARTGRSRA